MESAKVLTNTVLQLALVVFMNAVASYVFVRTIEIVYSPPQTTLQFFLVLVFAIGILLGTVTVLIVPKTTGSSFFIFLLILFLPAILAESRVSGLFFLQYENNFFRYEIYILAIAVVGGYFYLRHVALADQTRSELLAKGGSKESLNQAAKWGGYITGLTVLVATAIVFLLIMGAPLLANAFQPALFMWLPFYIFIMLGTVVGFMIIVMLHFYQKLLGEKLQIPMNQKKTFKSDFKGEEEARKKSSVIEERLREFIEKGKP